MKLQCLFYILLLIFCACCTSSADISKAHLTALRCEYRTNPTGLDSTTPRLSWQIASGRRGEVQTGYQILVASNPATLRTNSGDLWDSGRVASFLQNQIAYAGKQLPSRMQCCWKVRIWDGQGKPSAWSAPATWSMGLLNSADWKAKWIGVSETPEPAPARPHPLRIQSAVYQAVDGSHPHEVTQSITAAIKNDGIVFVVSNANLGGDPAFGKKKQLVVKYTLAGKSGSTTVPEGEKLLISAADTGTHWPTPRMLRKQFNINASQRIRRATLYATALGLYEVHLNGRRVGDHLLAPEWTNYHRRVQYDSLDVTAQLKPGANVLGAVIGNGWYCGGWQQWESALRAIYGSEPYLLAQLEVEYADGSKRTIATDASWQATTSGPLRFAGIYEGATYDARREMPGWDSPGFNAKSWKPALPAPKNVKVGKLVWQRSEPIRVTAELPAIKVTQPKPGVYVFDLGQNIAGWCHLSLSEARGTEITLLHNEVLNPDGTVYMDNLHAGHLCTGDRQIDRYICSGNGLEGFEPNFTYHGFRYVEVHGLTKRPTAAALIGRVFHTSFQHMGEFQCSNPLVNRLVENIQWSQRGNMMGIPTDCCQRDERCGYTGDGSFFSGAAVYNYDIAAFYNKWLVDVCEDSQLPGGWFADHAPFYGPGASPNVGWYDGGIFVPYRAYRTYGDVRLVKEHYAAMRRCMEWQIKTANPNDTRGPNVGNGDWLNLGGGASGEVIGTTHYAYCLKVMAEMAAGIGEKADSARYNKLCTMASAAFFGLIEPGGKIKNSSQTGYALAYTMGLIPHGLESEMAARFSDEIERFHNQLATGFIGTPRLLPALHLAGRDDLAYKLLLNEGYPSWLYEVKNGATTVWERWDGWRPEVGYQDSGMNSFNHYSFGAVGEYLFRNVGGISEETPGYRNIRIDPVIEQGLTYANASYGSQQGEIKSHWARAGNGLELRVTIPANCMATVCLPANSAKGITESGVDARRASGVHFLNYAGGRANFRVGSGSYAFRINQQ